MRKYVFSTTVILLFLKVFGVIHWLWWVVFSPLIVYVSLWCTAWFIGACFGLIWLYFIDRDTFQTKIPWLKEYKNRNK